MGELGNKALSGRVIDAEITVHRELGPGFWESVYELALVHELRKRGIEFRRQVSVPILYMVKKWESTVSTYWLRASLWWSSKPSRSLKTSILPLVDHTSRHVV